MVVAYSGDRRGHSFGRIVFESLESGRVHCWGHGEIYGLHDTDVERTALDVAWDE